LLAFFFLHHFNTSLLKTAAQTFQAEVNFLRGSFFFLIYLFIFSIM